MFELSMKVVYRGVLIFTFPSFKMGFRERQKKDEERWKREREGKRDRG